jgi:hypothetical protein
MGIKTDDATLATQLRAHKEVLEYLEPEVLDWNDRLLATATAVNLGLETYEDILRRKTVALGTMRNELTAGTMTRTMIHAIAKLGIARLRPRKNATKLPRKREQVHIKAIPRRVKARKMFFYPRRGIVPKYNWQLAITKYLMRLNIAPTW